MHVQLYLIKLDKFIISYIQDNDICFITDNKGNKQEVSVIPLCLL